MSKYQLENLNQADLKKCSYFCFGMIKIQRELGTGIIEYKFIDELIEEHARRGHTTAVEKLRNA